MISRAGNSAMYSITLRAKFYSKAGREFDTYVLFIYCVNRTDYVDCGHLQQVDFIL